MWLLQKKIVVLRTLLI